MDKHYRRLEECELGLLRNVTGTIKWFDKKKGYGFILSDGGDEYFFHYSSLLKDGFKTIDPGQKVLFDVTNVRKGVQAINVMEWRDF